MSSRLSFKVISVKVNLYLFIGETLVLSECDSVALVSFTRKAN